MDFSFRKKSLPLKVVSSTAYDLPAPLNLTMLWNFGALLGVCLSMQILSGLFLAAHYSPEVGEAFGSIAHIIRDVNHGWVIRSIHANGASCFFLFVYFHIGRGLYFHSYNMRLTWITGCTILILLMAIAFTGYVLPWGQMSFWAATVITNLFSVIPYVGGMLVEWLWGGFSIGEGTLKRFFVFHFVAPFILSVLVAIHIYNLHGVGSGNPLGIDSNADSLPFHSFYSWKDLLGVGIFIVLFLTVCLYFPDLCVDPVNWIPADSMSTPAHIQPEWYFLFAYAILRSIPSKLGGVVALAMSVMVLYILPLYPKGVRRSAGMNMVEQMLYWDFVASFLILTFIGSCPIDPPFVIIGLMATVSYFSFFITYPLVSLYWGVLVNYVVKHSKKEKKNKKAKQK